MLFIKVEWGYGECSHFFCCDLDTEVDSKVSAWASREGIECPSLCWTTINFELLK